MVYTGSSPAEGFSSSTLHHTLLSLANCFGTFFCVLLESENMSHCENNLCLLPYGYQHSFCGPLATFLQCFEICSKWPSYLFTHGTFTELVRWIGLIPLLKHSLPGRLYPFILTNFWGQHLWDYPSTTLCNPSSWCTFSQNHYSGPTERRHAPMFPFHSASGFLLCNDTKSPCGIP